MREDRYIYLPIGCLSNGKGLPSLISIAATSIRENRNNREKNE